MDLFNSTDGRVHLRYLGVNVTVTIGAITILPLFFLNNGFAQVRTSPFQIVKDKIIDLLFKKSLCVI